MIDLEQHPEYWERLGALPEAIRAFVEQQDSEPYVAWLRFKNPDRRVLGQVRKIRDIISDIRRNGYDAERWRSDPRQFGGLGADNFGPIVVTVSGTSVWPWDGAHRSCILRCLGLPVLAEVKPS